MNIFDEIWLNYYDLHDINNETAILVYEYPENLIL